MHHGLRQRYPERSEGPMQPIASPRRPGHPRPGGRAKLLNHVSITLEPRGETERREPQADNRALSASPHICHSEERSDEESAPAAHSRSAARLPPYNIATTSHVAPGPVGTRLTNLGSSGCHFRGHRDPRTHLLHLCSAPSSLQYWITMAL